jgi:hypothetical protein
MRGHVLQSERLFVTQGNNTTNSDYGVFNLSGSVVGPDISSGQLSYGANNTSQGIFNIVGFVRSGETTSGFGANNASDGLMTIIGDISGGQLNTTNSDRSGANNAGRGTLIIKGNLFAGPSNGSRGAMNSSTGILAITGDVFGGGTSLSPGAVNSNTGLLYIEGNAYGSSGVGAQNTGQGILIVTGIAKGGGASSGFGASNTNQGSIIVGRAVGNEWGRTVITGITNACPGVNSGNLYGLVKVQALQMGIQGVWPTTGNIALDHVPTSSLSARTFNNPPTVPGSMVFVTTLTGGTSFVPAVSNVRLGIVYDLNSKTGTLIMPPAEVVLRTEPLDDGFGAASFDSDLIWTVPLVDIRALANNTIGRRLLNVATLDRTGDARVQLR